MSRESERQTISEREQNLWSTLSGLFANAHGDATGDVLRHTSKNASEIAFSETVATRLLAQGFSQMDAIRHVYFTVVAPGMSLLRLTGKDRHDAFSPKEIFTACFQFHRPRYTRFFIRQFGRVVSFRAGGVVQRWEGLEKALLRQLAMGQGQQLVITGSAR